MRVAVMQPYLFPYIGYIQLMSAVDHFVFLDDVAYINKGWINRNRILVNGKDQLFTVPLVGASQNRLINSIEIAEDGKWRQGLLRTVEMAYKKSPYFEEVFPLLKSIVDSKESFIGRYISGSFRLLNEFLGIQTKLSCSSDLQLESNLKGEDRVIAICKHQGCTQYINPIGGTELYSREKFTANNMQLNFIRTEDIRYKQRNDEFVPWLSVIDVLMYNGRAGTKELLGKYSLI